MITGMTKHSYSTFIEFIIIIINSYERWIGNSGYYVQNCLHNYSVSLACIYHQTDLAQEAKDSVHFLLFNDFTYIRSVLFLV
jgi:hypothetical protein